MNVPELKKMLVETSVESVKIISGQIIIQPIVAKTVDIFGGEIRAMVLARVITISDSDVVIGEGGKLVCGRLIHDLSYRKDGGKIFAGEELYKMGPRCSNYNYNSGCSEFLELKED